MPSRATDTVAHQFIPDCTVNRSSISAQISLAMLMFCREMVSHSTPVGTSERIWISVTSLCRGHNMHSTRREQRDTHQEFPRSLVPQMLSVIFLAAEPNLPMYFFRLVEVTACWLPVRPFFPICAGDSPRVFGFFGVRASI